MFYWSCILCMLSYSKDCYLCVIHNNQQQHINYYIKQLLQPSDRLKSEEEIAKEEKECLEKLEEERIKRMKGFDRSDNKTVAHRSADDLDDG